MSVITLALDISIMTPFLPHIRIFESHENGKEDCLRLLVGRLPQSKTGPAKHDSPISAFPLSPHYARVLADLAVDRGFDGYLLNFECPLQGGIEQTRALAAWNSILQSELQKKLGTHAQTIWYAKHFLSFPEIPRTQHNTS